MRTTRVLLLASLLCLAGGLAAAPVASADVVVNVPVCDPVEGFCGCYHVATVESERDFSVECTY